MLVHRRHAQKSKFTHRLLLILLLLLIAADDGYHFDVRDGRLRELLPDVARAARYGSCRFYGEEPSYRRSRDEISQAIPESYAETVDAQVKS